MKIARALLCLPIFRWYWICCLGCCSLECAIQEGLPLYYWKDLLVRPDTVERETYRNFGDVLSLKIVERIVGGAVRVYVKKKKPERKLLALGSIFYFAVDDDVIWGSGINGKTLKTGDYQFSHLDIRAVRGPLTRRFLMDRFQIDVPEVYGDPALLFPALFPEFQKQERPSRPYVVVPHYADILTYFPLNDPNVIYPWEPWEQIVEKILDSEFVIASSLHGVVVAEAFGIPARMLRVSNNQHMFKYQDYYSGTNRPDFQFATTVEEALWMGGEPPIQCDLEKLYAAFPFEFWPNTVFQKPNFGREP